MILSENRQPLFGIMRLETAAPRNKLEMPAPEEALPGRATPIPTARQHFLNGRPLQGPYPDGLAMAMFGLGCFWGAERKFWELGNGIYITAVGYAGGLTPNPTYE